MITALPDFRLETWFSRWEFAARYTLTASDVETMTVAEVLELDGQTLDVLAGLDLGYRPTFGTDELRCAVAGSYDVVTPADVLAFAGAQEALFWVLAELLRDGGHAVVTVPNYQSIESVPIACGADVSGLALWTGRGADLRWTLDPERLVGLLRPDTRVVVVNFPNNPTGFVPPRAELEELARVCDERGIVLVSDEVFRGIEPDPGATLPQAADLSPRAVSVNVMSKSYGLPGLRVGWVACRDRDLLGRLERRKHYTSICNAGPSELIAAAALRSAAVIHARNRALVATNVALVEAFTAARPRLFQFSAPDGGCVAFPRYLGPDGVETFVRRAVEEAGILMLPASVYSSGLDTGGAGEVPADRFRIGVGRRDLPEALEALATHLDHPRGPSALR
jgi:aspartate/methionine/tyrosine aminotransferase